MFGSLQDLFRSNMNSKQYTPFLVGVPVILPTGEKLVLKISPPQPMKTEGFRFSKFYYCTEIRGGGFHEAGFGEAEFPLLAIQKSISEAVERILFRALKGTTHGTPNSNGWAAHVNKEAAKKAALYELLERDAVLVHWFSKTPFSRIQNNELPKWLPAWSDQNLKKSVFPEVRVLISHAGHAPTVSTQFLNADGHGVISHAAGDSLENALVRAFAETCRLARMAVSHRYYTTSRQLLDFETPLTTNPVGPAEQAVAYAHHFRFPAWLSDETIHWKQAKAQWNRHLRQFTKNPIRHEFNEIIASPLSAGYCTSPDVQNLFFGRTEDAKQKNILNFERLGRLKTLEAINQLPHFVA
ncbi:YcaO-like family protein [Bdellovibrionota bacterium FG-2]